MGMTITIKTTSYDLEAELPGLGWLKDGCSADSLKGKSNNIKKKKINMQVPTCKHEKISSYVGVAGTSWLVSLNGKVKYQK